LQWRANPAVSQFFKQAASKVVSVEWLSRQWQRLLEIERCQIIKYGVDRRLQYGQNINAVSVVTIKTITMFEPAKQLSLAIPFRHSIEFGNPGPNILW